jgi:hypothetical protein
MAQWILVEKLAHKCLHTIGHNPHTTGPEIHLSSCLGRKTIPQKLNNEFSLIPDFFVWLRVSSSEPSKPSSNSVASVGKLRTGSHAIQCRVATSRHLMR